MAKDAPNPPPQYDLWICQGRMCTAHGSDELEERAAEILKAEAQKGALDPQKVRLLRGGCYGLCELAPNAVIREWKDPQEQPSQDEDRLVLIGTANETVYATLKKEEIQTLVTEHLIGGQPAKDLTRQAREAKRPARSTTAERIRALRARARNRPAPADQDS